MTDPTPDSTTGASADTGEGDAAAEVAAPRRWSRWKRRLVQYPACLVLLLMLVAPFSLGDKLFFFPKRETIQISTPTNYQQQSLEFSAPDGPQLQGLLFKPEQKRAPALVLHLHGNAYNLNRHAGEVLWLCDHGLELMLFDYRGYGESEGSPDIAGVIEDSRAAIRHAHELADGRPLIIIGQSLGGAMTQAAYADPTLPLANAVVLESTFASFHSVANSKLGGTPLTSPIVWALLSDGEQPRDGAAQVAQMPCLVLHGTSDGIVGHDQGREVVATLETAGGKPEHIEIDGGGHLDLQYRARIQDRILELIESVGAAAGVEEAQD